MQVRGGHGNSLGNSSPESRAALLLATHLISVSADRPFFNMECSLIPNQLQCQNHAQDANGCELLSSYKVQTNNGVEYASCVRMHSMAEGGDAYGTGQECHGSVYGASGYTQAYITAVDWDFPLGNDVAYLKVSNSFDGNQFGLGANIGTIYDSREADTITGVAVHGVDTAAGGVIENMNVAGVSNNGSPNTMFAFYRPMTGTGNDAPVSFTLCVTESPVRSCTPGCGNDPSLPINIVMDAAIPVITISIIALVAVSIAKQRRRQQQLLTGQGFRSGMEMGGAPGCMGGGMYGATTVAGAGGFIGGMPQAAQMARPVVTAMPVNTVPVVNAVPVNAQV